MEEEVIPIEKIKVLDHLPSCILAGALKQTKYYLDIGRVDYPYTWFIRYTKSYQRDTYCIVRDKDLYSVTLTMLSWLDRHKDEFNVPQ